jgi:hypothetical protein
VNILEIDLELNDNIKTKLEDALLWTIVLGGSFLLIKT